MSSVGPWSNRPALRIIYACQRRERRARHVALEVRGGELKEESLCLARSPSRQEDHDHGERPPSPARHRARDHHFDRARGIAWFFSDREERSSVPSRQGQLVSALDNFRSEYRAARDNALTHSGRQQARGCTRWIDER